MHSKWISREPLYCRIYRMNIAHIVWMWTDSGFKIQLFLFICVHVQRPLKHFVCDCKDHHDLLNDLSSLVSV